MRKNGKRVVSLLMTVTMLVGMLTGMTVSAVDNKVFTSQVGIGTLGSPYELTTVADILKMADLVKMNSAYQTAHYRLMNDIDMSEATDFKGISCGDDARNAFKGTFDGNFHVIKNMTIAETATRPRGFFYAMHGATIKNLGFENASVSGFRTGVLAGMDGGSTIENCFVKNSVLTNNYQWTDGYMGAFVGGVVDMLSLGGVITEHTVFNNCYSLGVTTIGYKGTRITDGGGFKGGVLWHTECYATLNNCYTDYGRFATKGFVDASDSTPVDYPTDEEKIQAEVLVVENSYKGVTSKTIKPSDLGSAFIEGSISYSRGLPVLDWEKERVEADANEEKITQLYVSLDGNDQTGDGSFERPFATILKARDTIRGLKGKLPEGGITVNIMGGTYPVSETMVFNYLDSGSEDAPIVYQAYHGEKVSFIGGKTLDSSKIQKVTDQNLLDRLVEEDAKDHLYQLDLKEQNVTMDPLEAYGWSISTYRPMRIYMNNNQLTEARWPNDDQSQMLIKCRPLTAEDGIDEDTINTTKTPIMYEYPDEENRSSKWTVKDGDAYIGGAIVYFWASENLLIDKLDTEKKIVTSLTPSSYAAVKGVGWGPQYKVYFANIFEEIDKPGESYVDREKGILYFYPVGKLNGADMVVSTLKQNMLNLNQVSYLSFKGIDFKETVETPVTITDCDHITIESAEISNTSAGGINMKNCTNTVIRGCNFYTTGTCAIVMQGGDRTNLIPGGNVIENNLFHHTNRLPSGGNSRSVLNISGCVGDVVQYNEFNDIGFGAVSIGASNDIVFQYNKVLNAEQNSSDAGAIYWGREIDTLGNVVRYNYFENVGSDLIYHYLDGGTACSFFTDDASTGGDVYGNIFLNGGTGQAVVGNGPQFSRVHNNISICTEFNKMTRSFQMRNWGPATGITNNYGVQLPKKANIGSWLYLMGMREPFGGSISAPSQSDLNLMWSDTWKNHYAETQWEGALNQYSKKMYTDTKALFDEKDYAGVLTYLKNNMPDQLTSDIYGNVSIGRTKMDSLANHSDNYSGSEGSISEADKALFVDFDNKDFNLSEEGLKTIRKTIPYFEEIPFDEMGLKSQIGGNKPMATVDAEVIDTIIAVPDIEISPAYTFTDADGDLEGNTKIYWYASETEDGTYEKIYSKEGKRFSVTEEYVGQYLKYEIIPYDDTVLRGDAVWSPAIYVEEKDNCQVTYQIGEHGAMLKNDQELSGKETLVSGTYSYQVVAEEGYEVDSVTVTSGEITLPITLNANNEFDVSVVRDTTIAVTFREKPIVPEIVTDSTILGNTIVNGGQNYQAYLAFATIKNVEAINGYGMYLNFPGGTMKLEGVMDERIMKMMVESNGKFAFRVFGDALKGKTITLLPYITENGNESFGEETEEITYE